MKTTDFSFYLQKYLLHYLPDHCGSTPQTIDTYRYSFISFLKYMKEEKGIEADRIIISDITRENIEKWYDWIEKDCGNSISTRNLRQAAMNGFIRFLEYEFPEYLNEYQRILSIRIKKGTVQQITYVKEDGIKSILAAVDVDSRNGLRDYTIISLMYSAAVRVSEITVMKVKDISFSEPASILVHGKGMKTRYVPIFKNVEQILEKYITVMGYDRPGRENEYLFKNHMNQPLTRQGVDYIVKKYARKAISVNPEINIPKNFSSHKIRHSAAMGLLEEGVDLIYIRDLLGHVSIQTTEIYAKTSSRKKREAIEAAASHITEPEEALWESDNTLKEWLKSFNRRR